MKFKIVFLILMIISKTQAAEFYEFYTNARALGMGGASLAVTNDETALLLNPAALGKLRNFMERFWIQRLIFLQLH
jgi:hypothetical protein